MLYSHVQMAGPYTLAELALAIGVAVVLGSVPTAYLVARARGVNIFAVGTRQAGATNVYHEVGRLSGGFVLFVDAGKGALAIWLASTLVGLSGPWLFLPAFAAVMGHWNSPMTRFRGGDGVATGVGVAVAIAPAGLLVPALIGMVLTLALKNVTAHPSLWAGVIGYATFLGISLFAQTGLSGSMVLGLTGIGVMILLHSSVYHRRRRGTLPVQGVVTEAPETTASGSLEP
ncbi:MAG: glycerol-3-phosphate acyltransferase [Dehalococcoidia bacterium]